MEATRTGWAMTSIGVARTKCSTAMGPPGTEDEIDEDVIVVGLEQPAFRRRRRSHPCLDEGGERALRILLADVEVDVVVGRRPAARPGREAAADQCGDDGLVERSARALHRVDQPGKALARCVSHAASYPGARSPNLESGYPGTMDETTIRIAAAGDLHCAEPLRERIERAFRNVAYEADVILLAGDLTTQGEPEQALVLADACRGLEIPVVAVLGNHDYHADRCAEVKAILEAAGITILDRSHAVVEVGGLDVGIVGCKGFIRRLPGAEITDFGERLLRDVYRETGEEVLASRGRPRGDLRLPPPDRAPPLRSDRGHARR